MHTSQDVREAFLKYFESQGHTRKASSPLVPDNDPTVLLTTAGMQQFIPYFLGEIEAPEKRYTTSQKCFRTVDIEEVGDDSHLTFFEMLGNFSIGDYFKKEAIAFHWELFTEIYKLPKERLWITVFEGDEKMGIPLDSEAVEHWESHGMKGRTVKLGAEDNFWGPPGEAGPCGPSTEIYYDFKPADKLAKTEEEARAGMDDDSIIEIGNIVFMEYFKDLESNFTPLENKNVDQGTGLERLLMAIQHSQDDVANQETKKYSVYKTDVFDVLIQEVRQLSPVIDESTQQIEEEKESACRTIADHIRGATFLIADGVVPGKEGREYILRRILRRAIEAAQLTLQLPGGSLVGVSSKVIEHFGEAYPELREQAQKIAETLQGEEHKYSGMLSRGAREVEKRIQKDGADGLMKEENLFDLRETHGLSLDTIRMMVKGMSVEGAMLTPVLWDEKFDNVDQKKLKAIAEEKKKISQRGMKSKFDRAGGGSGPHVATAHTGTHLLHSAVKRVLGPEANQAGSQLGDGEFRFDFTWPEKLTDEQKAAIEKDVNDAIVAHAPVREERMSPAEAKKHNAIMLFEHKYGDEVRVFFMGEEPDYFSVEVCGGPHVTNTGDVGHFRILKEKSSSAGVRRIKAEVGKTPKDAKLHL